MYTITMNEFEIIIRLVLALILGSLIGVERVHAGKNAGIRTLGLVALGSAFFVVISEVIVERYNYAIDPLRMSANIISGIGFLGAGMIVFRDDHLANLTTAAGVWVAAAIGTAVGFGMYWSSIVVSLLVIITFTVMWNFEHRIREHFNGKKEEPVTSDLTTAGTDVAK